MTVPTPIKFPRKLIDNALPLDSINVPAARKKSTCHGCPGVSYLWSGRQP